MSLFPFTRKNVYAKKASLTYDEILWFYKSGGEAERSMDDKEKKAIENRVFDKLYSYFPEKRNKTLSADEINKALESYLSPEDRMKIIGKVFE